MSGTAGVDLDASGSREGVMHAVVGVPGHEAASMSALAEVVSGLVSPLDGNESPALQRLLADGARAVMRARWGWVTLERRGRFTTVASTGGTAEVLAAAQYEAGCGPTVEVLTGDAVVRTAEISDENQWGGLSPRLREELGVCSLVSYRLPLLDEQERRAALSFAWDRPGACCHRSVDCGLVLAGHAGLLLSAQTANATALQLVQALESNREIGVAVGVLMTRHQLTRDQAFAVLRATSQNTNRKLAEVATEVADTGALPPGLPAIA